MKRSVQRPNYRLWASICLNPSLEFRKQATGGDDFAWKIWSVPGGEMIIQGESHRDWISGLDFSPAGTQIATSSGDSTIKIWDLVGVKCAATFKAHAMPVYSVSYHHTGDFIVSGKLTINSRFQGSDSKVA